MTESFAEKELKKFGWVKGKGLGKSEDGIKEPIRIKFNMDTKGIGYEKHQYEIEFDDEWWKKAYNNAAEDVIINNREKEEEIGVEGENRAHKRKRTKGKMCVFLPEGANKEGSDGEVEIEKGKKEIELISMCMLSEASRHDISSSGKQKRIALQEAGIKKGKS